MMEMIIKSFSSFSSYGSLRVLTGPYGNKVIGNDMSSISHLPFPSFLPNNIPLAASKSIIANQTMELC